MKFHLLRATALALVVSPTSVLAYTKTHVSLRGSDSVESADEFEEVDGNQCTPAPQLASDKRGSMPMSQVCRIKYGNTVPYTCSINPGFACCQPSTKSKVKTTNVGKCKKALGTEEEEDEIEPMEVNSADEFEEVDGNQCTPAPQLASDKRGSMPMNQVCRIYYKSIGMTEPYSCSHFPGHACCKPSTKSKVKTTNVGKCKKEPRSEGGEIFVSGA